MGQYYNQDGDVNTGNNTKNFRNNVLPVVLQYTSNRCYALDIGCGNGRMTKVLSEYFSNVVAIDQLDIFNKNFKSKNIIFEKTSIEEFNTNNKFDLIMLWGVFYVLNDHMTSLVKCQNLLSSKGIIVIGDDAKRRIDKNPPGSKGVLYNISKLCNRLDLYEVIDFGAYLRVTILSKQKPHIPVCNIIKGKNLRATMLSKQPHVPVCNTIKGKNTKRKK